MGIYKPGRPFRYKPGYSVDQPPARPGLYHFKNPNGDDYIGETNNLKRRTYEHLRSGKLSGDGFLEYKVADRRSTSYTRRQHEQTKILRHNPTLNMSKGGEGRIGR